MDHIETAKRRLREAIKGRSRPFIMSSFGKDSMVVIDLCSELGVTGVIHTMYLDEPEDEAHLAKVVDRYGLTVLMLKQGRAVLSFLDGKPHLVVLTAIGKRFFPAPLSLEKNPQGLCVDTLLSGTNGGVNEIEADLLIWGRRNSDYQEHDTSFRLLGEEAYKHLIQSDPHWDAAGLACVSPIVDWTTEQVWDYIEERNVPVSPKQYTERKSLFQPLAACWACHDPGEAVIVSCPKLGREVLNPHGK